VLFLSSGEIGLADKIAEDGRGKKMAAGQRVRIVDVSADAGAGMGMFENLRIQQERCQSNFPRNGKQFAKN
jgi:hypothetical protein